MILIIPIIIYIILLLKTKKRVDILKNQELKMESKLMIIKSSTILFIFLFVFIFFIRFLNLFKEKKVVSILDAKNLFLDLSITKIIIIFVIFILIRNLRRTLVQTLKLSFIKLNIYFINKSSKYFNNYIKITTWQISFWYWLTIKKLKLHNKNDGEFFYNKNPFLLKIIYYLFKFGALFILILCFIVDIFVNQYNLIYFMSFLPWFSMYQTIYNINWYFQNLVDARQDCNLSDFIYPSKYDFDVLNKELLDKLTQYLEDITKF